MDTLLKPYSQVKAFPFTQTKAAEESADGYLVHGHFTTAAVDRDGEVMVTGGIRNWDDFAQNPVLLYNHRDHIGHSVELKRHSDRIETTSLLAKGHKLVEETVWPLVKAGSLRTFSIGFSAIAGHQEKSGAYYVDEWDLWEHSLVTIPANPTAQAYLKGLGLSLADANPLGRYKWPEADAADPWPSIAAIAVRIAGARGGAGLSGDDRQKAWAHALTFYTWLGKALPELGASYAETVWHNDEPAIFEDTEATDNARSARGLVIGLRDLARGRRKAGGALPADALALATETEAALQDLLHPPVPGGVRLAEALKAAGYTDGGTASVPFSQRLNARLAEVS